MREVDKSEVPSCYYGQTLISDHPVVVHDNPDDGRLFYKANTVMKWLRIQHKIDLNALWEAFHAGFVKEADLMQFYRDIGYSLGGFDELFGEAIDRLAAEAEKT
jgi:hypothetical protein